MRVLKLLFLSLAFVSQITVYASYAPHIEPETVPEKPQNPLGRTKVVQVDYSAIIEKYALKWQISGSEELMEKIIMCESSNNTFAHAKTEKEDSWGLSQINLMAHTHITKEQAVNPDFAIDFLAEHISKGNAPQMWYTCYKKATQ